jgi:sulfatase modifying factor 1
MTRYARIQIATAFFCSWMLVPITFAQERSATTPPCMVPVPAGRYTPLFRSEKEPKDVPVAAFLLDVLPVTNGEFLDFVRANPKWRRSQVKRLFADEEYLKRWAADLEIGTNAAVHAPVTHVSWFAAKAFASWKNKRLPTIAEWEYAAAASTTRPDGDNDPEFTREVRTWYSTLSPEVLPVVGRGRANYFGAHDLHGLVWEWVADFNTAMVTGDARGDTGLDRQLFCGAGSEGAKDRSNFPAFMRYGFRSSLKASYTVHNLGFRCARSLTQEEK